MSTATYFFVKTDFGTMQCTPLRMSTTIEMRQSPTIEASDPPARRAAPACIQSGRVRQADLTKGKSSLYYSYMNKRCTLFRKRGQGEQGPQLMFSLIDTGHAVEQRLEQALAQVGLSLAKFGALTHLVEAGEPISLSECATKMTCVRSNITQLVDRLEADGLVKRVEDPNDRRAVRAAVTPLGLERQAAGAKEVAKVQAEFAKTLSGADHGVLQRALSAIR